MQKSPPVDLLLSVSLHSIFLWPESCFCHLK